MRNSSTHTYTLLNKPDVLQIVEIHDHDGYNERITFFLYDQADDTAPVGEVSGYIEDGFYNVDHISSDYPSAIIRSVIKALVNYVDRYFKLDCKQCAKLPFKTACAYWKQLCGRPDSSVFVEAIDEPDPVRTWLP